MPEHCINLTAAEIRAYRAGERVLRRRVKPQPEPVGNNGGAITRCGLSVLGLTFDAFYHLDNPRGIGRSPFGQPGDTLVLREAWLPVTHGSYEPWERYRQYLRCNTDAFILYKADYLDLGSCDYDSYWRSSTQMPRWAVRYTATLHTVRVEHIDGAWWWVAEIDPTP